MENHNYKRIVKRGPKGNIVVEPIPEYHSSASETLESKICGALGKMVARENNLKSELRYIRENKKFMTKALRQLIRLQKQLASRGVI